MSEVILPKAILVMQVSPAVSSVPLVRSSRVIELSPSADSPGILPASWKLPCGDPAAVKGSRRRLCDEDNP
jgi:hypothetical protein